KLENNIIFSHIDKYLPLIYKTTKTILDYLSDDFLLFAYDMGNIKKIISGYIWRTNEDILTLSEQGVKFLKEGYVQKEEVIYKQLCETNLVIINDFLHSENDITCKYIESFNSTQVNSF